MVWVGGTRLTAFFLKELRGVHGEGMAPGREGPVGWCEFSGPVWKALLSCLFLFPFFGRNVLIVQNCSRVKWKRRDWWLCSILFFWERGKICSFKTYLTVLCAGWEETIHSREMFGDWQGEKTNSAGAFLQLLFSRFSNCVTTLLIFFQYWHQKCKWQYYPPGQNYFGNIKWCK